MGLKELSRSGEGLIETGYRLERQVDSITEQIQVQREALVAACELKRMASERDENGNPRGDVSAANANIKMIEWRLQQLDLEKQACLEEIEENKEQKKEVVSEIDKINHGEQSNIEKLKKLQSKMMSRNAAALISDIIMRMNRGEETRDHLLQSMGQAAGGVRYSAGSSAGNTSLSNGNSCSSDYYTGDVADQSHTGRENVSVGMDDGKKRKGRFGFKRKEDEKSTSELWNQEYLPLVKQNIRSSVEKLFSGYVTQEKLESSLDNLRFMSQKELLEKFEKSKRSDTILGFNDGQASNIADNYKASARSSRVGEHELRGSGETQINLAFVTAVHENLHMLSANENNRGLMVGKDESARAMNEAITEYFTYLSCGGDEPLGGLYPGEYSLYHSIMRELPRLVHVIGMDCVMDAYFNNKPERMQNAVDTVLGEGAWREMCAAANDCFYNKNRDNGAGRLIQMFDRLDGEGTAIVQDDVFSYDGKPNDMGENLLSGYAPFADGALSTREERVHFSPGTDTIKGEWQGDRGNSVFVPRPDVAYVLERGNGNRAEAWGDTGYLVNLLEAKGLKGIEYIDGIPDFSPVAEEILEIPDMSDNRARNVSSFCRRLAKKWNREEYLTDYGKWTESSVKEYCRNNDFTIHECNDRKTCMLIPTVINEFFDHLGGVSEIKKQETKK